MKMFALLVSLVTAQTVLAADFPQIYCVSTKSFENVNQITIFTNSKGTLRMNLQFYAVSDDGQDAGNFDTAILQTVTQLKFNESTGEISNGAGKLKFVLGTKALTQTQADNLMKKSQAGFDLENMSGHKILFKRYFVGQMTEFNLKGTRGNWDSSLMKAYQNGVTEYVCGHSKDMKGRRPNIFDDLGND